MKREEIEITASLARIGLKEGEMTTLIAAVEQMLEYFETMKKIDVSGFGPTAYALLEENRLRKDTVSDTLKPDPLLKGAPELEDRFIVIPNVL
jgi:aspartyl-tRNA(Asn)/glutamyl-tRNA(Gln) amidotransferase subunit C